MGEGREFLRVRGMGRERFAGYLAEFLQSAGFTVDRKENGDPPTSIVTATLTKMNPAVPDGARVLEFRFYPTSGGASMAWIGPTEVPEADRPRLDRFVRELVAHLERVISTESHATAKVTKAPTATVPWQASPAPRSLGAST